MALIATPIILDVIDDARISAGQSEAQMILGGINNYCATEDVKYQLDNSYTRLCMTDLDGDKVKEMVNLGNATIDKIKYNGTKLTELVIISNNHKFTLCPSGQFAMDDEECDDEVALITTGPIKDVVLSNFPYLATNGNGCVTPTSNNYNYMGGCYLKGNHNNNYIWYSGFLWRIMGINADETVRLITDENVTSISLGKRESDTVLKWDKSYVKDWLNNYFYSRLKGNNIIKEETWCSETATSSSSARTTCTNNLSTEPAKIGLITIDEYNLAGGRNSYLNISQEHWTMTPRSNYEFYEIHYKGYVKEGYVYDGYSIYAVINVNANTTITSGNGTLGANWSSQAGPYILNEDKNVEVTGKLNEKATSGEYVMFAGRKHRVVDKDSNGNTKLILDGYYEETNDSTYTMEFGSNKTFSLTTGIGQKLNGDVLNWLTNNSDTEKAKLVSNYTWYQNDFGEGYDYKISLNEENPTKINNATVGLIRIGEMLSSQSSSMLTKDYTIAGSYSNVGSYWTMTSSTNSSSSFWYVDSTGGAGSTFAFNIKFALRPVIVIKSNVEIISGTGTFSNPYVI